MPPAPPTGIDLLEAILVYLEDHVLTNGYCACGAEMDTSVDVSNPQSPTSSGYNPLQDTFTFTCLACQRQYIVRMEDLVAGAPVPDIPEADWPECSICRTKHRPVPAALIGTCAACERVSKDIGQIVGVREEEPIL